MADPCLPKNVKLNSYVILSPHHSGAFGQTYMAYDVRSQQKVLIKEHYPHELCRRADDLTVQPTGDPTSTERGSYRWSLNAFVEEVHQLSSLSHPNVVPVLAAFRALNTAYMVMPYLGDQSLLEYREKHRCPQLRELLPILRQLLSALEYIHGKGLLHRDIKPGNVMIQDGSIPVLIDFGSARRYQNGEGSARSSMTCLVSPGFSAPEQYLSEGRDSGPWSDLFSVAATMYYLMCGRRYEALTMRPDDSVSHSLLNDVDLVKRYGRQFIKGLEKGLELNYKDRWQSASDWLQDLDSIAIDVPAQSLSRGKLPPIPRMKGDVDTSEEGVEPPVILPLGRGAEAERLFPDVPGEGAVGGETGKEPGHSRRTPKPGLGGSRRKLYVVLSVVAVLAAMGLIALCFLLLQEPSTESTPEEEPFVPSVPNVPSAATAAPDVPSAPNADAPAPTPSPAPQSTVWYKRGVIVRADHITCETGDSSREQIAAIFPPLATVDVLPEGEDSDGASGSTQEPKMTKIRDSEGRVYMIPDEDILVLLCNQAVTFNAQTSASVTPVFDTLENLRSFRDSLSPEVKREIAREYRDREDALQAAEEAASDGGDISAQANRRQAKAELNDYKRMLREKYGIVSVLPRQGTEVSSRGGFALFPVVEASTGEYISDERSNKRKLTSVKIASMAAKASEASEASEEVSEEVRVDPTKVQPVDIVYVMDLTRSMSPFCEAVKDFIARNSEDMVSEARRLGVDEKILRFGFVGYREKGLFKEDDPNNDSAVCILRNSSGETLMGIDEFKDVVSGAKTTQTDSLDFAEDMLAGLNAAAHEIAWRSGSRRFIFLIGDAPGREAEVREGLTFSKDYGYRKSWPKGTESDLTLSGICDLFARQGVKSADGYRASAFVLPIYIDYVEAQRSQDDSERSKSDARLDSEKRLFGKSMAVGRKQFEQLAGGTLYGDNYMQQISDENEDGCLFVTDLQMFKEMSESSAAVAIKRSLEPPSEVIRRDIRQVSADGADPTQEAESKMERLFRAATLEWYALNVVDEQNPPAVFEGWVFTEDIIEYDSQRNRYTGKTLTPYVIFNRREMDAYYKILQSLLGYLESDAGAALAEGGGNLQEGSATLLSARIQSGSAQSNPSNSDTISSLAPKNANEVLRKMSSELPFWNSELIFGKSTAELMTSFGDLFQVMRLSDIMKQIADHCTTPSKWYSGDESGSSREDLKITPYPIERMY